MARTGVILMAFGGPESIEQVGPFMAKLMGRPPAPPILERVVARYRTIGGGSPLARIVREQAAALERLLAADGTPATVRAAFKYTEPAIGAAVRELARAGCERIVGVSDSPHHTRVTTGAYLEELRSAGAERAVQVVAADPYYDRPHFLDGIAERAEQARGMLQQPDQAYLIFSAHSLPVEYVETGDPYVAELLATVAGVLERLPGHEWQLAYQSRGMGQGRWLEPTVETVLEGLAADGRGQVLLIPVGFTCDHVETLYDIDVAIAGKARELRITFQRAAALNAAPAFIRALAAAIRPHLS